jgi:hypothetical protein
VREGGERRARCREAEARAPFIGWEGEWRGRDAGGQAAADGASSRHQLLEGEATG